MRCFQMSLVVRCFQMSLVVRCFQMSLVGCALFSDELGGWGTKVGDFPEVLFSDELGCALFSDELGCALFSDELGCALFSDELVAGDKGWGCSRTCVFGRGRLLWRCSIQSCRRVLQ